MSLKNIVNEIEKADNEQVTSRRDLFSGFGTKVALASLPLAIGSLLGEKKAQAATTADSGVIKALNYLLSISYMQYNFFRTATATGGLITINSANNTFGNNDMPGFRLIEKNERAHVVLITEAIVALGGTPYTPKFYDPTFTNPYYVPTAYDFTQKGVWPEVFSNYEIFLMVAQTILDTAVRAFKSQILLVSSNAQVMKQVLQMHSVEGRHAAFTRTVRRYIGSGDRPAPWITNDIAPLPALLTTYKGEDNTMQFGGNDIETLPNKYTDMGTTPKISATAAFDEPIDEVVAGKFFAGFMV